MKKRWIKSWKGLILEQRELTDLESSLGEAVFWGNISKVKRLLRMGVDPDFYIIPGYHLIESAMNKGKNKDCVEIIRLLLRNGIPHKIGNGSNEKGLMHIGVISGNPDVIRLLLEEGLDPNNEANLNNQNPLDNAISLGRLEIAEILLDGGADPNLTGESIYTAIYDNNLEALRLLLRHGADPDKKSTPLMPTPLELSKQQKTDTGSFRSSRSSSTSEDAIEQAKALITAGAKLTPAFKDFEDIHDWFDGDLSWAPGGEEAMRRKFRAIETRKKMF